MDFVSNSSSTSFVYIAKEMMTKEDFFDAAGVSADSPVGPIFEDMFYQLRSRIEHGDTLQSVDEVNALEGDHGFIPEVLDRMREAIRRGETVTTGYLSSESDIAESVLCMEIFEIESERFFINAYANYW
jgi:hypothetical protein